MLRRSTLTAAALAIAGLAACVATATAGYPLDPGGDRRRPQLAARADGTLWAAAEDAAGHGLVLYRSADHGRTWTREFALGGAEKLSRPAMALAEGETSRLLLVYERGAAGPRPAIVAFWLDLDLGTSGTAVLAVAGPGASVGRPSLCVDAPEFHHWYAYVVHHADDPAAGPRVELCRSLDFGRSWSAPRPLLAAAATATPDLDFGRSTLHVVAEVGGQQRDVTALESLDFGATWSEPALLAATAADESGPRVAAANDGGGAVAVAWTRGAAAGGTVVEAAVRLGDGAWLPVSLSGASPEARRVELAASPVGGLLHAAWLDGATVVHAYAAVDRPAVWSVPLELRGAGTPDEARPSVAANPRRTSEAAVVWAETAAGSEAPRAVFAHGSWPATLVRADGSGDYRTIQAALEGAGSGSEVMLAPGVYSGPGNVDLEFGGRAAIVRGLEPFAAECVIDCGGSASEPHRAFRFGAADGPGATVRNVTITGGYAAASGPGGGRGGGVLIEAGGSPTFEGVVFLGNLAEESGGALHGSAAASAPPAPGPTLSLCRFERNVAATGGGALRFEGPTAPTVAWSVFYANRSESGGGDLDVQGPATLTVSGCSLVLGSGSLAAGISLRDGATAAIDRSILAFGRRGAAVSCDATSGATAFASDIWGNAGGNWVGCLAGLLEDPLLRNLEADPLFCGLGSGVLSLRADSPCQDPLMGPLAAGCAPLSTGADPPPAAGLELSCAPNPFNPRTEIRFRLPRPGPVRLSVHDLAGRRVALLVDGILPAGEHRVPWQGRDGRGRALPSGVYVGRLEASGSARTLRLVLVR